MAALSILDLAFVTEGATPADALRNTLDLAQHAERWGYTRFWLAEQRGITASSVFPDVVGLGRFLRWQLDSLRTMLM